MPKPMPGKPAPKFKRSSTFQKSMKYSFKSKAFKLEGIPQLMKCLQEIRKVLNVEGNAALSRRIQEMLLVPMMVIRDEAQDLVPKQTGKLHDAIYARIEEGKPAAIAGVSVKDAFYAAFVERGTSRVPAKPYFRPAVAATRPLVARMVAEKLPGILADAAKENRWIAPGFTTK